MSQLCHNTNVLYKVSIPRRAPSISLFVKKKKKKVHTSDM